MSKLKMIVSACFVVALAVGLNAPIHAQKEGKNAVDTRILRAEIAKLRADLDEALREIRALKAIVAGGKTVPEDGQLYGGRPTSSWLEQLKDANPSYRADAIDAIGALAATNKKLEAVLLKTLQEDPADSVGKKAVQALAKLGTDNLAELMEIAKVKTPGTSKFPPQLRAIEVIGLMKSKAKPAVPVLAAVLREANDPTAISTTTRALSSIGPDASAAIPALVEKLDLNVQNMLKTAKDDRDFFNLAMNTAILKALIDIDPDLANHRDAEPLIVGTAGFGAGGGFRPRRGTPEEWRTAVDALKKRYAAKKQ